MAMVVRFWRIPSHRIPISFITKYARSCTFDLSAYSYPDHVKSEPELEDFVRSPLPEKEDWRMGETG